jgi:mRNA-degrading endonuclease RelE of RelBE toxin-antitoxin system
MGFLKAYKFVFDEQVVKFDIPKIQYPFLTPILHAIEARLADNPLLYSRSVEDSTLRCYNIEDYRIIFTMEDKETFRILKIGHISEVGDL